MKIKNILNYEPSEGHYFTQPSQTVPDQAMSVREIMTRYANGQSVGGSHTEYWDENEDNIGINLKNLDLVDIQEMKKYNTKKIDKLKSDLEEAKKNLTATPSENIEPEGH